LPLRSIWTLRQVLVRRPDPHLLDAVVLVREMRGRRERVVGLQFGHRPDDDAHRCKPLLQRMELREERRIDALAGLVAGPEAIAEGLDHVVGRDADMRDSALDHLQHAVHHADRRAQGLVLALREAAQAVEVPEEFVGSVDQVNQHGWVRQSRGAWPIRP
jgi:hypothetical protein